MQVGEIEKRSGVSRDTLRFYERSGLIGAPSRRDNGYRDYGAHTLVELRFIATAKAVGFTLDEIREAIPKLRAPPEHCPELIAKLEQKKRQIRGRIAHEHAQLKRLRQLLMRFGDIRQ